MANLESRSGRSSIGSKLQGKVIIITGGASGIGEATVRLFVDQGAEMVVIADIQDEKGHQVVKSIGGRNCAYYHCDVSDEKQVENLVKSTVQNYGRLDIMFSNAGIVSSSDQHVLDLDFPQFDQLFSVNVRGMTACVKHSARAMVEQGIRGSIVCTASVMARHGSKRTDYCMSKHAVLGLMRAASSQLADYGIRVNCVSPNVTATPMTSQVFGLSMEEVEEQYNGMKRLKGVTLTPKHVADAVLFLASDDSQLISGHDLAVDGIFAYPERFLRKD